MAAAVSVSDELRQIADLTLNTAINDDFLLFRIEAVTERICRFAAHCDSDVDPAVMDILDQVASEFHVSGQVSRPRHLVPPEYIEHLLLSSATVADIAALLGVSERTVHRRMAEGGIRVSELYSNMTNDELDEVVAEIHSCHPNTGYKMMLGHLNARGIRIQRSRVQDAMHRVDHEGVLMRTFQLQTLRRRTYSVPAPNSLWHIDGNHKLIRWRIVIHGGIDGFSRLIVYLNAATNNRASTVLSNFIAAVNTYGVPSRVRSDKGGENIQVAQFMVSTRGPNRNSHLTGRSTHNQRIERLWRDVFGGVLDLFYTTFCNLETQGLLNPDRDVHLYALHWTFLPQINRHLHFFMEGWNHHRLRTEGNQSPQQLWSQHQRDGQDLSQVDVEYGIDWDGPHGRHLEGVVIPEIQLQRHLTEMEIQNLPDPRGHFSNVLDVYSETVNRLSQIFGHF